MTDEPGLHEVIASVGEARFVNACEWAWKTAAGTGRMALGTVEWPNGLSMVPHEAEEAIWTGHRAAVDEAAIAFALYRRMPCYGNLMYVRHAFSDWTVEEPARALFWREYRGLISDPDDRLADPVAYSLWCDYFEDPQDVNESWAQTALHPETTQRGLERVLSHSGPVPFPLKADLYERLIFDPHWHPFVFASLLHSRFDAYGSLDRAAARDLLQRLQLSADTEGLDDLKQALANEP